MLKVFWRSSSNQGEETHRFEREKNQIPESVFTVITEEQPGSQASRRFLWLTWLPEKLLSVSSLKLVCLWLF